MRRWIAASVVATVFFVIALRTLPHYNIMWDARNHFFKGAAFANFFLFGRTNYDSLPITKEQARYYRDYGFRAYTDPAIEEKISPDPNYRRSIYQGQKHNFEWLMSRPATEHPVFSDILSSISNIVFYEKLGWLRDDHAYNILAVALAAVLVGIVFHWMVTESGWIAAVVATLALATTGLFWAESHNNIKDIPQMTFFSLAVWAWWQGFRKKSRWFLLGSAVAAGAALGTKFNVVFLPFILGPWTIIWVLQGGKSARKFLLNSWWLFLLYPLIMFAILVGSWPQMWHDPMREFLNVVRYYQDVGVGIDYTPRFRTIFGFSYYPALWIAVTTYPPVLALAIVGAIRAIWGLRDRKGKEHFLGVLLLFWLMVPIGRASLPSTSIFGGVRHIIEYIPAMAMLAGWGAWAVLGALRRHRVILTCFLVLLFIPHVITLVRLHPAENAYFNIFIGGLSGAKERNLTGWGNTDGGIYRKALVWINENVEPGAHLSTSVSELADFYLPEFREDIRADNLFSGYLQQGEYIIGLTHNSELENTYRLLYPQTYLDPVWEYVVDGVALIKIWKNDADHLRADMQSLARETVFLRPERKEAGLFVDLGEAKRVESVDIRFPTKGLCAPLALGFVELSSDGSTWQTLPETYPGGPVEALWPQPANGKLIAPIAAVPARYIVFRAEPENSCVLGASQVTVSTLVNKAI